MATSTYQVMRRRVAQRCTCRIAAVVSGLWRSTRARADAATAGAAIFNGDVWTLSSAGLGLSCFPL